MAVALQLALPPSREISVLASGREEVSTAKGGRKRVNKTSSYRPRKQAHNLVPSLDRQTRSGQPLIHPARTSPAHPRSPLTDPAVLGIDSLSPLTVDSDYEPPSPSPPPHCAPKPHGSRLPTVELRQFLPPTKNTLPSHGPAHSTSSSPPASYTPPLMSAEDLLTYGVTPAACLRV